VVQYWPLLRLAAAFVILLSFFLLFETTKIFT